MKHYSATSKATTVATTTITTTTVSKWHERNSSLLAVDNLDAPKKMRKIRVGCFKQQVLVVTYEMGRGFVKIHRKDL